MNLVHLHLLLNHLPIFGALFGVLLLGLGFLRKSSELTRVSFGFLAALGVASLVVYLTGEPAEDAIEKLPDFSKALTEQHEAAALVATIVTGTIGALALAALIVYRRRAVPRWLTALGLVAALGSAAVMGYTANLGGQIRHTEIRAGATSPATSPVRHGDAEGKEH